MFFGKFNKIQYNGKTVTDITSSILLKYRPMNNTTLYTFHTVSDGETAITLADKYYNEPTSHWVIMLLNEIVDPIFDWALTSSELVDGTESKYGTGNSFKVNHLVFASTGKRVDQVTTKDFVDATGTVIATIPATMSIVTNMDVEIIANNLKREIKILAPRYLQEFKNQFEDLISNV